jgi:hypothetical protein
VSHAQALRVAAAIEHIPSRMPHRSSLAMARVLTLGGATMLATAELVAFLEALTDEASFRR